MSKRLQPEQPETSGGACSFSQFQSTNNPVWNLVRKPFSRKLNGLRVLEFRELNIASREYG
jgi:hypothetical protein